MQSIGPSKKGVVLPPLKRLHRNDRPTWDRTRAGEGRGGGRTTQEEKGSFTWSFSRRGTVERGRRSRPHLDRRYLEGGVLRRDHCIITVRDGPGRLFKTPMGKRLCRCPLAELMKRLLRVGGDILGCRGGPITKKGFLSRSRNPPARL